MKILILGVGKTKQPFLEEGIKKYIKQTRPYCRIEELYLKEEATKAACIDLESEKILKAIPANYFKILLDLQGDMFSSEDLAVKIDQFRKVSTPGIVFIIGGHSGVNKKVKDAADLKLCFSKMTFTHQMIRLFLTEQIYRAYTILHNKKYHK